MQCQDRISSMISIHSRFVRTKSVQDLKMLSILSTQILSSSSCLPCSACPTLRAFSVLNRPPPQYNGHMPLNGFERSALAVGSAVMSLYNPRRGGSSFFKADSRVQVDSTERPHCCTWRSNSHTVLHLSPS